MWFTAAAASPGCLLETPYPTPCPDLLSHGSVLRGVMEPQSTDFATFMFKSTCFFAFTPLLHLPQSKSQFVTSGPHIFTLSPCDPSLNHMVRSKIVHWIISNIHFPPPPNHTKASVVSRNIEKIFLWPAKPHEMGYLTPSSLFLLSKL